MPAASELCAAVCPRCARLRDFEQPPCPDGHGESCPERACVVCGTAIMLAPAAAGPGLRGEKRHAA